MEMARLDEPGHFASRVQTVRSSRWLLPGGRTTRNVCPNCPIGVVRLWLLAGLLP